MRQPEQPRKPRPLNPRDPQETPEREHERVEYRHSDDEIADAEIVGSSTRESIAGPNVWEKLRTRVGGLRKRLPSRRDAAEFKPDEIESEPNYSAPIEMSERRAEKRREERKVRLKKVGIGAGLVVVLLFAVWLLFASPLFQYQYDNQDVTIAEPDGVINVERAHNALAEHEGVQLLSLNTNSLAADLIAEIPEIRAVKIERDLPSGLNVTMYPHEPVACLGSPEDCQPVAADGTKLRLGKTVRSRLPVVSVDANDDVAEAVEIALDVLDSFEDSERSSIEELKVSNAGLVTLELTEGRSVFWGASEENDFKAEVLSALLSEPAKKFDISVPRSPVTS